LSGPSSGPPPPASNEALTALVVGDDPLSLELLLTLRERGLEASAVPHALSLEAVRSMAPDLVVLVCDDAADQHPVLTRLAEDPTSALLPVVLVAEEEPSAGSRSFTQGVVAGIGRERGSDAIAELVLRTLVELPERSGESHGVVEETTLDELVGLLSRELRTGVLSVQGETEARIVLRAGQPLDQRVDSFMAQVRPMLRGEAHVHYAFHEQASLRLDSVRPAGLQAQPAQRLADRRVLVVHPSVAVTGAWTRALRQAGAQVVALSDALTDLDAVRPLDPEVMLIDPAGLDGPLDAVLSRLRKDSQLRWTAALMAPMPPTGPDGEPSREAIEAVTQKVAELTAPLRALAERGRRERAFETRLEHVGPSQLLRALLSTERKLRIRVRHPEAGVQVDLAQGQVAGASGVRWEREDEPIVGYAALSLLLSLRSGRVHVEPIAGPPLDNLHMQLEIALSMAGTRSSPPPASIVPERLVSQIPRAPRLPRVGASRAKRVSEIGRKAARLLLTPEQEASSGSRLALLVVACLFGAAMGLPAQLEPLQLGNQPGRVQLVLGPTPRAREATKGASKAARPARDAGVASAHAEGAARRCAAGQRLRAEGKWLEAETEYLHALVEQPDHPEALEGLVRVKLADADADAATDWALRLLAVAPDEAPVQLLLGDVHLAAGRRLSAIEAFRRAETLGASEGRTRLLQLVRQ
jgi:CheY-like chemotaxis protein